jgi:hypothetical protein
LGKGNKKNLLVGLEGVVVNFNADFRIKMSGNWGSNY